MKRYCSAALLPISSRLFAAVSALAIVHAMPWVGRDAVAATNDAPSDIKAAAMRLASEGASEYKAGRFPAALSQFEAAYRMYPAPALALNLSHVEIKLGHCDKAIEYALTYGAAFGVEARGSMEAPEALLATVKAQCAESEITSFPPGTEFLIEGVAQPFALRTPWKGRLPLGQHWVAFRRDGLPETRANIIVAPGAIARLHLNLFDTPGQDLTTVTVDPQALNTPEPPPSTPTTAPAAAPIHLAPIESAGTPAPTAREQAPSAKAPTLSATELPPRPESVGSPIFATPPATRRRVRALGWSGIGVGALALAVGLGLGIASQAQQTALHTTLQSNAPTVFRRSNEEAIGADALFGIGAVVGAAGTAVVVVF